MWTGDLVWITVLAENYYGQAPTAEETNDWFKDHRNAKIPVLGPADDDILSHVGLRSWPHVVVLNGDLTVAFVPGEDEDFSTSFDFIAAAL